MQNNMAHAGMVYGTWWELLKNLRQMEVGGSSFLSLHPVSAYPYGWVFGSLLLFLGRRSKKQVILMGFWGAREGRGKKRHVFPRANGDRG